MTQISTGGLAGCPEAVDIAFGSSLLGLGTSDLGLGMACRASPSLVTEHRDVVTPDGAAQSHADARLRAEISRVREDRNCINLASPGSATAEVRAVASGPALPAQAARFLHPPSRANAPDERAVSPQ